MPDQKETQSKSPLVPFLVKNAAIGFLIALVFVGAILVFNVGNLMTVAMQSGVGVFAIALMTIMIGLTFASLQMGFAVMFRAETIGKNDDDRGGPGIPTNDIQNLGLQPISARAHRTRKPDR